MAGPRTTERPASETFTVLLFASAATFAGGVESVRLPAPTTLGRLLTTTLEARFPGFAAHVLVAAAVTVNLEYVDVDVDAVLRRVRRGDTGVDDDEQGRESEKTPVGLDLVIRPGDEVGILPPVSSG